MTKPLDTMSDGSLNVRKMGSYYRRWEPLAFFHSHVDAPQKLHVRDLARELGVSPQTLYNDIDLYYNGGKLQENANRDFDSFLSDSWQRFRGFFSNLDYAVREKSARKIETLRPVATVLLDECLEFLKRVGWTENRSPWTLISKQGGNVYTVPFNTNSRALWCLLFLAMGELDDEKTRRIKASEEELETFDSQHNALTGRTLENGKFETSLPPWLLKDLRYEANPRSGVESSIRQFLRPLPVRAIAKPLSTESILSPDVDTYPISRHLASLLVCPYFMIAEISIPLEVRGSAHEHFQ